MTRTQQNKIWANPRGAVILTCLQFFFCKSSNSFSIIPKQLPRCHRTTTVLHGINEWRAKYSNQNTSSSSEQQLPLLLLPFSPTQILLPGQTSSYTFRHGKYMDLIDESMTNYESVLGMSILTDDGLLPVTVLCEVIEEELEINMGYRGFSSLSVGIRAVGRVRRCDVNSNNIDGCSGDSSRTTIGDDLRTTALDDIHRGQVVDWFDDPLGKEQQIMAQEYKDNIQSVLSIGSDEEVVEQRLSEKLRNQQRYYASARDLITLDESNTIKDDRNLIATSWGALAAATAAIDYPVCNGSVNIDALSTTSTVERLRLGLAMLLENQMPRQSNEVNSVSDKVGETASTIISLQDVDTFQ